MYIKGKRKNESIISIDLLGGIDPVNSLCPTSTAAQVDGSPLLLQFFRFRATNVHIEAFAKVELLSAAIRTRHHLGIVRKEAESLFGMNYQLIASVALEPLRAAWNGREYVIGIHCSEN